MTEIGFYHLTRTPLDVALPRLLSKAFEQGQRVVLRAPSETRVDLLDRLLWTFEKDSFLPHGTAGDGNALEQPIYLTAGEENPNGAAILCLVEAAPFGDLGAYHRCLDVFDGRNEDAVAKGRERWRWAQEHGHQLTYWKQNERGGWVKSG